MGPIIKSFMHSKMAVFLYATVMLMSSVNMGLNGVTFSTFAATVMVCAMVMFPLLTHALSLTLAMYLHGPKPLSTKLYYLLFADSRYSYILPHLTREEMGLESYFRYREHYQKMEQAFVGIDEIFIPFVCKEDAIKWKLQDANSHLFETIGELNWREGELVRDEE